MKHLRVLALSLVAAAALTACGGGGNEGDREQALVSAASERDRPYARLVVFGDSLSDVGSYRTPLVGAIGGGRYTVNGPGAANWTELLAAELALSAPCAARTGLESSGPLAAFAAATVDHAGCYGYAQGGARVTHPVGPWNQALLALGDPSGYLGQLTDPVVDQIERHLAAAGGAFSGDDLVTVLAGANDLFMNLAALQAALAGGADPDAATVAAVTAMGQAGAELAAYVAQLIVANGATRVVVVNVPDAGKSPSAAAAPEPVRALTTLMAQTFNAQLAAGLGGVPQVLLVDAFSATQDQTARPARYGLRNVTDPACDLSATAFPSSLVCVAPGTVVAGDISRYLFADTVHPTPYGYRLLAQLVADEMTKAGWLAPPGLRPCHGTAQGCSLTGRH